MASTTLSAVAGAFLSPLRDISLEKLISYLWDYLSSSSPSSSDEAEKHQELEDSLEALEDAKLNVRLMQSRIIRLFEKHKQNHRVVSIHNKLKDVGYEIQDLESDLEYMELQNKVEEINKTAEADTIRQSSGGIKRLFQLISGPSTALSSGKKLRLSTSSQSLNLSTDDDMVNKIGSIIKQIHNIESKMKDEIKLEEWFDKITLNGVYDPREQHHFVQNKRVTTSSPNERVIYGRDDEIEELIELLLTKPNVSGNISVVPVVGMGGIGKTTLVQVAFNNREIENYFDEKMWICVSNAFDKFRIIKEMVGSFYIDNSSSPIAPCGITTSLELLERKLKKHLIGKKFLLVLDDVWSDEWQQLLTLLRAAQAETIKIIVTCRDPKVLGSLGEGNKIILQGLSDGEYWPLFLRCAFANKNLKNYPQRLCDIGKQIVGRLKGSPLAAKTVGSLLGCNLTENHWKDVLESDLWELESNADNIMFALALSYYHLHQDLQLCFAFCSVFPKNFEYDMDSVIDMWIAHGYIHESGSSSKTSKDIGEGYFLELVAMCFFERCARSFKMHDLMHDLAQSISHGEICIYESGKGKIISKNVRHLYAHNLIDLGLVSKRNCLRTLMLDKVGDICAILNHGAFKRIRVLVVFDTIMQEFPDAIAELKHLQYLDLEKTNIISIPESLCRLYQLRVLKLPHLHALPIQFHNLINIQNWLLSKDSDPNYDFWSVVYHVKRGGGYKIAQLRNVNKVKGKLLIKGLENTDNIEEAMKANLKQKSYIKDLGLSWTDTLGGCKHDVQEEVLEGLQPHPDLNYLCIEGYMGSKSPSWLMTLALQKLQMIELNKCKNWARLPAALGLLPLLKKLHLIDIENVTIEGDDSVIEMFPSLEFLELKKATVSFEGMSSSSSLTTPKRLKLFPCLKVLTIEECNGVNGLPWPMLSALNYFTIIASYGLQGQVPRCLQYLNSLTSLYIKELRLEIKDIEAQQELDGLVPNLREIKVECCENMAFLWAVLLRLPSLYSLSISKCSPVSFPALGHLSFLTYISLEEVKVIVEDLTPSFASLCELHLTNASVLFQNVPSSVTTQNHNCFSKLTTLTIQKCDEMNGLHWPLFSALQYLNIKNSPGLDDQLPGCLYGLSSLTHLELTGVKIRTFPVDVMATLHALDWLHLEDCNELVSMEGLEGLPSLKHLSITKCPKFRSWRLKKMATLDALEYLHLENCNELISVEGIQSLPSLNQLFITKCSKFKSWCMEQMIEQGVLLPNLHQICLESCEVLESLPAWLPHLPSLKRLSITKCSRFHSLPEGGLPSSLLYLKIKECDPGLKERCQQEGSPEWLMAKHIHQRVYSY